MDPYHRETNKKKTARAGGAGPRGTGVNGIQRIKASTLSRKTGEVEAGGKTWPDTHIEK